MGKNRNGLGIPDDPRFLLPKDRAAQPEKRDDGRLLVGEFGWPAGQEGVIARQRAYMQNVCAEGTGG